MTDADRPQDKGGDQGEELGIPPPGSIVAGKYQVEGVIGMGGMASVVAAYHRDLGQRVAIKIMAPAAVQKPDAAPRFLREARTASVLRGEHSVRIHDVGKLESGAPYMVMEYLAGSNLAAVVNARGPLPVSESIDYILQTAEAVAEAHARGIVHRDLKPANLFLSQRPDGSGVVKVLDFGISKAVGPAFLADLTATTDVMGTPIYMSPEQVRSARDVDLRSDIWSLGAVLYELLTARPPFMADTLPALSAMIASDPAPSPRLFRPDLPPHLDGVVLRCLEKDRTKRPQSVGELAQFLTPYAAPLSHQSIQRIARIEESPPPSAGAPQLLATPSSDASGPWPRDTARAWGTTPQRSRRGLWGGILGVGTGVLAALVVVTLWFVSGSKRAGTEAVQKSASPKVVRVGKSRVALPAKTPPTPPTAKPEVLSPALPSRPSRPSTGGRRVDPLDERY